MKSLLVDAMRQANAGDTGASVSDSGSFEPADRDFDATANDEIIDSCEPDADELELLSSTGVLVVGDEVAESTTEPSAELSRLDDPSGRLSISHGRRECITAPERVPVLTRYSAHLCVLLAVVSAGSWLLYQQIEARYFRDAFRSDHFHVSANDDSKATVLTVADSKLERFPFIDLTAIDSRQRSDDAGTTP